MNTSRTGAPSSTNIRDHLDVFSIVALGVIFYLATPYWFSWTRDYYAIAFQLDGQQFEYMKAVMEGSIYRRIGLLCLALFGLDCLIRGHYRLRMRDWLGHLCILFIVWATASLLWSESSGLVLRKIVIFWCLAIGAFGVATRLNLTRLLTTMLILSAGTMLLSLAAELYYGNFDPFTSSYRFAGVMHPVIQGWNCGLLLLTAFALLSCGYRPKRWLILLALCGLAGILLTKSRWPLATSLLGMFTIAHFTWSLRRRIAVVLWVAAAGCVVLLFYFNDPSVPLQKALSMGRGEEALLGAGTLSGRTQLWSLVINLWRDKPFLGYGYNAFQIPSIINYLNARMSWLPTNCHSAYLQMLLGLGAVGLILFVSIFLLALRKALFLARRYPLESFSFGLLVSLVVNMLIEAPVITDPSLMTFTAYVIIIRLAFLRDSADEIRSGA